MDLPFFWQAWHPVSRRVYLVLLSLFIVSIGWFGVSYWQGMSQVVVWELLSSAETVSIPLEDVSVGVFDFANPADHYVVTENYRGSNVRIHPAVAYVLLAAMVLVFVFLLVIISTFSGFWFYFGGGLIILLILGMQWEYLSLFGTTGRWGAGIVMLLYLPATFFFQKIRPDHGLITRLLTFAGITVALATLIHFAAEVPHPALYLVSYGLVVPVVLSLFFVLLLGHEIVSFFLKLITQNNTPTSRQSFLHFSVIAIIYLANLTLLVLRNIGIIDWDILYFNAFLLLVISAVIGVWGFRDREVQYQYIVGFQPLGAYLYLVLGLLTFATLAYLSHTANDPILETFEDTIVYSQIGFSLIFTVYVIANFIQELMDDQRVYRIVYHPPNLPYGTMQIMGTVAMIALFARAGLFPFYQALAGYNNGLGDLYRYEGDPFLAEQYYKLGDQYGYKNHRSNYTLGALARSQNDLALATFYFNEATQKNPSPQAYVNLGNAFLDSDQYFEGVFALRQGLRVFPDNAYLQNNLALALGRTSVLDSALYYLQGARTNEATQRPAEANTLGVLVKSNSAPNVPVDSLLEEMTSYGYYLPMQINALALRQRFGTSDSSVEEIPRGLTRNSLSFARLHNTLLVQQHTPDTALSSYALALAQEEATAYAEPLSFASAVSLYRQNRVVEALKMVDRLQAVNVFKKAYYLNVMGLWMLEQQAPTIAAEYFGRAAQARHPEGAFRQAVSYTEAAALPFGSVDAARAAWDSLSADTVAAPVTEDMLTILNEDRLAAAIPTATDAFLYQALRYRYPQLTSDLREDIWLAFDDANYRTLTVHDLWLRFPQHREGRLAQWADTLGDDASLSADGQAYRRWVRAFRAEAQQDWAALQSSVDDLRPMNKRHRYWLTYFRARLAEKDNQAEATQHYQSLSHNPFFSQGYLAALDFLYPPETDQTAPYQLLVDATEVNPRDAKLLRAYVLAALRTNLESYAEEGLSDYQAMVSKAEYEAFAQVYETTRAAQVVDF